MTTPIRNDQAEITLGTTSTVNEKILLAPGKPEKYVKIGSPAYPEIIDQVQTAEAGTSPGAVATRWQSFQPGFTGSRTPPGPHDIC